jgi:hypothetical protein
MIWEIWRVLARMSARGHDGRTVGGAGAAKRARRHVGPSAHGSAGSSGVVGRVSSRYSMMAMLCPNVRPSIFSTGTCRRRASTSTLYARAPSRLARAQAITVRADRLQSQQLLANNRAAPTLIVPHLLDWVQLGERGRRVLLGQEIDGDGLMRDALQVQRHTHAPAARGAKEGVEDGPTRWRHCCLRRTSGTVAKLSPLTMRLPERDELYRESV